MKLLDDLNEEQRRAVEYDSGPALILAGAGSGKTRALTYRLAYLIAKGVEPHRILGVTFTNKAAGEMKERTRELLRDFGSISLPFLGTFHSIAASILRHELDKTDLGVDSRFVIFDRNDSQGLIKEIIKEKQIEDNSFNPKKVLNFISSCKQDQIMADNLPENEYFLRQVKPIFKQYQIKLLANNALDFDDILLFFLKLLKKHPQIREKYQRTFNHILVDEYQDTNSIQYEMVKILAGGSKRPNLVVVGDDWQSIYGFRGADYKNILNFKRDYPEAEVFKLEQNYRSTGNIVSAAQALIEKNSQRSEKKLWTDNKAGKKIGLVESASGEKEAQKIVQLIADKNKFKQTAVLYRTHAQSRLLEEALIYHQIPYQIIGGLRFYQRKEIKDLISYLFVVYQPNSFHLKRIINTPRRGIGKKTQEELEQANWQIDRVDNVRVRDFAQFSLEFSQRASELTVDRLIDWLIKKIEYQLHIKNYSETDDQANYRLENVQELINVASKYRGLEPEKSLAAFLEEVSLMDFQDEMEEESDKVTLMTLHNAKGLEFDYVFIPGMEEGVLPHRQSLGSQDQIEEERRLCYVGMTRAREELCLSWAQSRYTYGQIEIQDRSSFITEIPEKYFDSILACGIERPELKEDDLVASSMALDLKVGDWVEHLKLGRAEVVSVDSSMIEVNFPTIGKKKLSLEYAPIKKINQ